MKVYNDQLNTLLIIDEAVAGIPGGQLLLSVLSFVNVKGDSGGHLCETINKMGSVLMNGLGTKLFSCFDRSSYIDLGGEF